MRESPPHWVSHSYLSSGSTSRTPDSARHNSSDVARDLLKITAILPQFHFSGVISVAATSLVVSASCWAFCFEHAFKKRIRCAVKSHQSEPQMSHTQFTSSKGGSTVLGIVVVCWSFLLGLSAVSFTGVMCAPGEVTHPVFLNYRAIFQSDHLRVIRWPVMRQSSRASEAPRQCSYPLCAATPHASVPPPYFMFKFNMTSYSAAPAKVVGNQSVCVTRNGRKQCPAMFCSSAHQSPR